MLSVVIRLLLLSPFASSKLFSRYVLKFEILSKSEIGDYIAEQIYLKVNSDTLIPQTQKDRVQATYQNRALFEGYEALFDEYADDLQLP